MIKRKAITDIVDKGIVESEEYYFISALSSINVISP